MKRATARVLWELTSMLSFYKKNEIRELVCNNSFSKNHRRQLRIRWIPYMVLLNVDTNTSVFICYFGCILWLYRCQTVNLMFKRVNAMKQNDFLKQCVERSSKLCMVHLACSRHSNWFCKPFCWQSINYGRWSKEFKNILMLLVFHWIG